MHDTKQKSMEFFFRHNQNRMIKTKNETNLVKKYEFRCEFTYIRHWTKQSIAIHYTRIFKCEWSKYGHNHFLYEIHTPIHRREFFFCLQTLYTHGLRSQLTKLCCLCVWDWVYVCVWWWNWRNRQIKCWYSSTTTNDDVVQVCVLFFISSCDFLFSRRRRRQQ